MIARLVATFAIGLLFTFPAFAVPGNGQGGGQEDPVTEQEDSDQVDDDIADEGDNLHPSGKDRSVEKGPGSQGKSTSEPDGDGRGPDRLDRGTDKPDNDPGGLDIFDQDYNNGCGNDDDFEDDNEGWCGGTPDSNPPREDEEEDEEVLGDLTTRGGDEELLGAAAALGALAATGGPLAMLTSAAGALILAGTVLRVSTRPRERHRGRQRADWVLR